MAETESIKKMAELASAQIFSVFGWEQLPLMNQNWDCVERNKHRKIRAPHSHPSDAVFRYVDPYSGEDVYVNADLKSYAKTTLKAADLTKTIRDLGRAVECANKSADWKNLYVDQTRSHEVVGLLFIYNHDGGYDEEFGETLASLAPSQFELDPNIFLGVVGPQRVLYLNSIAKEIKSLHSDEILPAKEHRRFFFPHLNRSGAIHQASKAVPLPALLSPLVILDYEFPESSVPPKNVTETWHRRGYYAFYDGPGASIHEFKYLLDYFFKYQIADERTYIAINLIYCDEDAAAVFDRAKKEFARDYWPIGQTNPEQFQSILDNITFRHIQATVPQFHQTNLGMARK